jgi:hypothetical protein
MTSRRVRRGRHGDYELRLPRAERELLRSLGPDTRRLLEDRNAAGEPDPAVDRLFPVAYPDDEERQTEYRLLVHDELLESHLAALAVLEETADAERLDDEQLQAWMRALNEIRLVLGTRLGVSEDRDERQWDDADPRGTAFAVYDYLTFLQGEVIEALSR